MEQTWYGVVLDANLDAMGRGYGAYKAVKTDLFTCDTLAEAKAFAENYAKDMNNFDFAYLDKIGRDYFVITIRKYYGENRDEPTDWDDWDAVSVHKPEKTKENSR